MGNQQTHSHDVSDMLALSEMLRIIGFVPIRVTMISEHMMNIWTGRYSSVFATTDQWGCCIICRDICKGHLTNMLPDSNLSGTGVYCINMHVDCFGRMDKIRAVLDRRARWRLARWALMLPLPVDVRRYIAAIAHSVARGYVWTRQ
jgi:hypothetical protein